MTDKELEDWGRKHFKPEKISSHDGWYRGRWVTDTCTCGNKMRVPAGKIGVYRCNDCADQTEFGY